MPSGIPVAAMTIGTAGAINAAVFAARIVALSDEAVKAKLVQYVSDLAAKVLS
jgi:5-(carboxyamino)imidazole ribonucleotide mutase